MATGTQIRWLEEPEEKDFEAAESFLSMVVRPASLSGVMQSLRHAPIGRWAAKDIMRAAGMAPLKPKQSTEVASKLEKIKDDEPLSPILLVAGVREDLVIADGYHRASAAFRIDEDTLVPGRLLWVS